MSHEFYFWCIVDRYLSTGHVTYREALKFAQRDVYEIPRDEKVLELLANYCALNVRSAGIKPQSSQRGGSKTK